MGNVSSRRFVVGIDLGTSNTVVAFAANANDKPAVEPIAQRVTPTTIDRLPLLPSCLYAGLPDEIAPNTELDETDGWVLGEIARRRGAEVPSRLVSSSKSWLCHPRVDKEAAILPWGSDDEDVPKLSPVEAAKRFLERIRRAWDADHRDAPLATQDVVLTVPASFDEVARELTLRAARSAGLVVRLLEEPQAAFYAAMHHGSLAALEPGLAARPDSPAYVLVCDVGGGTTDLSLLEVRAGAAVRRVAVGHHLLLGGDNMDLALGHRLEARLVAPPERLDPRRFSELTLAAKRAKEQLLVADGPSKVRVSVLGRGSKLFGSTLSVEMTRDDAEMAVLNGFLPFVERDAPPARPRGGLIAFGLPYERDVAITRHVTAFLTRHLANGAKIDAILLNGGVFRARLIADRLIEVVAKWQGAPVLELESPDPDLAVALGAVTFGLALRGHGARITGGAARSYFLGIGRDPEGRSRAIAVVPKGSEEGSVLRASSRPLKLTVGRPARFDLHSSDVLAAVEPGDVVVVDDERFEALPPLTTTVVSEEGKGDVGVVIEAELTAVGTLDIACVERHPPDGRPPRRYRLAFDLRSQEPASEAAPASIAPDRPSHRPGRHLDEALGLLTRIYGKGTTSDARDAKNLVRDLEKLLGGRDGWSADTTRTLADRLLSHAKGRRRSVDHERVFFQLVGFCIRPGFGAPGDEQRVSELSPMFFERLTFPKDPRSWQQFFICFRRAAGGIDEKSQSRMRDELDPFVAPAEAKLKKPKGAKPESESDMLELISHLERVAAPRRSELAGWILERTWTQRDPRLWAAIGRLGARVPAYASVHHVVSPSHAERWIDHLLREKWADLPTAPRAASELARVTGDRSRDVSESVRREVLKRLERERCEERFLHVVRELVAVESAERATFFGERLPAGLTLA